MKNTPGLPFAISAQSVGAQKAYRNFIKQYGASAGRRFFLQKAMEKGTGRTIRERVNSTYKTGAKLPATLKGDGTS